MRIEVGAAPAVEEVPAGTAEPLHGLMTDGLAAAGLRGVVAHDRAGELPDPRAAEVTILLSPPSAAVDHAQVDWIRRADEAGARVLAIGRGASALALAFGASHRRLARPHQGWSFLRTRAPHLIPTGPWLTWQEDVITLAPQAEVLADNRLGPQVFRIGRHVGLRFDPVANQAAPGVFGAAASGAVRRDPGAAEASARRLIAAFCDNRL